MDHFLSRNQVAHTQFRVIQGQLNDGSNVIRRKRSQGIFEFPEFSSTNTPTLIPKGSGNSDYWKLEEERRRALLLKDALSLKKPEREPQLYIPPCLRSFVTSLRLNSIGNQRVRSLFMWLNRWSSRSKEQDTKKRLYNDVGQQNDVTACRALKKIYIFNL